MGRSKYSQGRGNVEQSVFNELKGQYERKYSIKVSDNADKLLYIQNRRYDLYHAIPNKVDLSGFKQ